VDLRKTFNITYGTGSLQGDIITDNIVVAGLKLPNHTFGVATTESETFAANTTFFDGIMGLAQSNLSTQKTLTPPESLLKAGLIIEAIVSYKIPRLADKKNDGEVTFGGLAEAKFNRSTLITLNNVNTKGFWEVGLDAVSVDGNNLGLTGRTAIMDTGSALIFAPLGDAQAIHKSIPGANETGNGTFTVPCTTNSSIALTFGQQSFAIDPRDIVLGPVDQNDPPLNCASGITAGQNATEWLAGAVFLKNAYFSTDVGKNTIQLAKLV
jgi:hypothetical protein